MYIWCGLIMDGNKCNERGYHDFMSNDYASCVDCGLKAVSYLQDGWVLNND